MLSSRGAVYYSEATAGGYDDWHDFCRCVPESVNDDSELSYDSRALYEQYSAVHQRFMTDRDVAAAMREAYGLA